MHDAYGRREWTWQEQRAAFDYWTEQGFVKRHANALANGGYARLEDLQAASDFDLKVLPNLGNEGRVAILRLLGRPRPANLRTAAEVRDQFEQAWRGRIGNERFDQLMVEINVMAFEDLDRANHPAAQALWELARKRRPPAAG
jgi:hypothetical protein